MPRQAPTLSAEAAAFLAALPPVADQPDYPLPTDAPGWSAARREAEVMAEGVAAVARQRCPYETSERDAGGLPALMITTAESRSERIAIYLHGGAYTYQSASSTAFSGAQMARAASATVVSIDYPLAPESTAAETVPAVARAITSVVAEAPDPVALFGESAGAGLAVAALDHLADEGENAPAAAVLMSPWADLTASGASHALTNGRDALFDYDRMLARAALSYSGGLPLADPMVSPALAVGGPFPPTLIQAGTGEILLSDAVLLHRRLRKAGGLAALDLYDGLPHVFQVFMQGLSAPEAGTAYEEAGAFLDRHAW